MVKNLAPGDYAFIETKAPTGYRLDSKPTAFKIKAEAEEVVKENHLPAVQVTKYNEPIKALTPVASKSGQGDLPQAGKQSDLFVTGRDSWRGCCGEKKAQHHVVRLCKLS